MLFSGWYTDKVEIYRVQTVKQGALSRNERQLVTTAPCRVYSSQISGLGMQETAARDRKTDKLACDISVDIRAGDELIVTRGASLGFTKTERYFAGTPQDFYDPVGGALTGLQHKEVGLLADNIIGKGRA